MKKGKSTNVTTLAKKTVAGALSLSMVFSTNMMTLTTHADGETPAGSEGITLGQAVNFENDGVVLNTSGNAASIAGDTIKIGESVDGEALAGVQIQNPFVSNAAITAETITDAQANSGNPINTYVYYRKESADKAAQLFVAPFSTVEEAKAYDTAVKGYVSGAGIVTTLSAADAIVGNADFTKPQNAAGQVKIMNLACVRGGAEATDTEVSFPFPEWQNGVSMSMWVKASSSTPAPIFSFGNTTYAKTNCGGLSLFTDGTVFFAEATNGNGVKNNRYTVTFSNDYTPNKHVGEWIYVTLNIKNDGCEVFFNGESTSMKAVENVTSGNLKYFNHGYGFAGAENRESQIFSSGTLTQRLQNYNIADFEDEDTAMYYDDIYNHKDSDGEKTKNIMQYLADKNTTLYIGGLKDGDSNKWLTAPKTEGYTLVGNKYYTGLECRTANEGMQVAGFSYSTDLMLASESKAVYELSPVPEYTDSFGSILGVGEDGKGTGIEKDNSSMNGSSVATDENGNAIVTLGKIPEDEFEAKGVQVTNMLAGKTLNGSLAEALEATGKTFYGWTCAVTEDGVRVNKVWDAASKTAAVEKYNRETADKMNEFTRNQVWSYVTTVSAPSVVTAETVGGKIVTGGGLTYEQAGVKYAKYTLADYMLYNAQAMVNGTGDGGRYANIGNLKKKYVNQKQISTEELLALAVGVDLDVDEIIAANKFGKTFGEAYPDYAINPADLDDAFSFPYPTWSQGASVSVWVKASTAEAATALEFSKNNTVLTLKTDGTVKFNSNFADPNNRNVFGAKFDGETPAKHVGEWVYVTMTMKNDGISVYYNGVKATPDYTYIQGDTSNRYFNFGFGYDDGDIKARIAAVVKGGNYQGLLKEFGASTDYSDFTKYSGSVADDATYQTIMKLVTNRNTELYLGGSEYSAENDGMKLSKVTFFDYVIPNAKTAETIYKTAVVPVDVETPPASDAPVNSDTPASAAPASAAPGASENPASAAPASPAPSYTLGDVNNDQTVDLKDAQMVLKMALKLIKDPTDEQKAAANVNKDETVDLKDAQLILKFALKLIKEFPQK